MANTYTMTLADFNLLQGYRDSGNFVAYYDKLALLGDPLVFDSTCNPDLHNRTGYYVGFCRITFYWKVDMFVTYDFDPTKRKRDTWRRRIHQLYSALRYLEQEK